MLTEHTALFWMLGDLAPRSVLGVSLSGLLLANASPKLPFLISAEFSDGRAGCSACVADSEMTGMRCLLKLRPCQPQWPRPRRATIQRLPEHSGARC